MADLFTRLAERAHRQAHTIAPRMPARFERPLPDTRPDYELVRDAESPAAPASAVVHPAPGIALGPVPGVPVGPAGVAPSLDRGSYDTPSGSMISSRSHVPAPTVHAARSATPPPEPRPDAAVPRVQHPRPRPDIDASPIRPAPSTSVPAPSQRAEATGAAARRIGTAAPDVHIHIGHLEIRSAPSPTAQPSVSAAAVAAGPAGRDPGPARLSLSAYLRGDDGRAQ